MTPHVKTRLPQAVDLAVHMEQVRIRQRWQAQSAMLRGMWGGVPYSDHERNVDDYVNDRIDHAEYERREGERLGA
jgi:hypothetical protein